MFGFCGKKRNLFIASFFGAREFLSFYILHLLLEKNCYGEGISKCVSRLLQGLWKPNPGFIYPILKRLERHNFIKGSWLYEGNHPRYVYEITDRGKKQYNELYKSFSTKLDEFIKVVESVKQEVFKSD